MLKIGLVRLLAIALFGVAVPYALHKLARRIGLGPVVGSAVVAGLAYGAVKADNPWSGDGLASNLLLMATSALVLAAYAGLSVWAASAVARLRS